MGYIPAVHDAQRLIASPLNICRYISYVERKEAAASRQTSRSLSGSRPAASGQRFRVSGHGRPSGRRTNVGSLPPVIGFPRVGLIVEPHQPRRHYRCPRTTTATSSPATSIAANSCAALPPDSPPPDLPALVLSLNLRTPGSIPRPGPPRIFA